MIVEGIKAKLEAKYFSGKVKDRNLNSLVTVKESKGWAILADFLGLSADKLAEQILDTGRVHDKELDDKNRETLDLFRWLIQLPDKLLDLYGEKKDNPDAPNADPYEQVAEKDL